MSLGIVNIMGVCVCMCPDIFIPSRSFSKGKCTILDNCCKTLSL